MARPSLHPIHHFVHVRIGGDRGDLEEHIGLARCGPPRPAHVHVEHSIRCREKTHAPKIPEHVSLIGQLKTRHLSSACPHPVSGSEERQHPAGIYPTDMPGIEKSLARNKGGAVQQRVQRTVVQGCGNVDYVHQALSVGMKKLLRNRNE